MSESNDMRSRILDTAQMLVQTRGYAGFSYADVAEIVAIRKASIHHHFATKGDLGCALIQRFRETCRSALIEIDSQQETPLDKLRAYTAIFRGALVDDRRMCLCGMLAAGYVTLPDEMRVALMDALGDHETWLVRLFKQGRASEQILKLGTVKTQAVAFFSALEGALLVCRLTGDLKRFDAIVSSSLSSLEPTRR